MIRLEAIRILGTAMAAALMVLAASAGAQDARTLINGSPDNRSGDKEVSRAIAALIASRSDSPAVKERASTLPSWGRLTVGPDEVLAAIGASDALGMPRSVPVSPSAPAAIPSAPPAPAPAAKATPAATTPPQRSGFFSSYKSGGSVLDSNPDRGGGGGGGGGW